MSTRRSFLQGALSVGALSLASPELRAAERRGKAFDGLREAVLLGRRLRGGELSQSEWREQVVAVLRGVRADAMSEAIELPLLRKRARRVRRGASVLRVPVARPLCTEPGSNVRVFFFEAGRADPPHCHYNMVSVHMVLIGRFRVRHYDRVREEARGVVLRPTHERVIGPGEATTISDQPDNAHWHQAETAGVLLAIQQGRLDPKRPIRRRQSLDPNAAQKLAGGLLLAPRLSHAAALRRYG